MAISDTEREAPQTNLPNLEFNRWEYVDGDIEGAVDADRHEGTELLIDIDPDDFAKRYPLGEGIRAWRSEAVLDFSLFSQVHRRSLLNARCALYRSTSWHIQQRGNAWPSLGIQKRTFPSQAPHLSR